MFKHFTTEQRIDTIIDYFQQKANDLNHFPRRIRFEKGGSINPNN